VCSLNVWACANVSWSDLAEIRRARYGSLLALHILLLCAAQRTPTEGAAVLVCSRSTV